MLLDFGKLAFQTVASWVYENALLHWAKYVSAKKFISWSAQNTDRFTSWRGKNISVVSL
jgi:hypothetical protein